MEDVWTCMQVRAAANQRRIVLLLLLPHSLATGLAEARIERQAQSQNLTRCGVRSARCRGYGPSLSRLEHSPALPLWPPKI